MEFIMEDHPSPAVLNNCCLYVYDAKNGNLYAYTNLTITGADYGCKVFADIKGEDSYRILPHEYEIKRTGSYFSIWFSNPTIENQNKAIEILKRFIKDYSIKKTGEVTKEFNKKCGYYRTLIKNSEKLNGNGVIFK